MQQSQTPNEISVEAIPAFTDNYIWKIISKDKKHVVLVDPGDAQVCIHNLEKNNQQLAAILITHHHVDHTGGVKELVSYAQVKQWSIQVIGPSTENTPCNTHKVIEGDQVTINELSLSLKVIDLPGHTLGHVAYFADNKLFSGDTLFSGGCGRLFEGTPEQMHNSLQKLAHLPTETHVYCTHEYTLANLQFASTVDPKNHALQQYQHHVRALRSANKISLPTTIKQELAINPFLRCADPTIRSNAAEFLQAKLTNEVETFAAIRHWKDNFKG